MTDFVDEQFLRGGSDLAQAVAHLACEWARANTRTIDFEYIYTLAHLLSFVEIESPLAYPLAPGSNVRIKWSIGPGQGTKERDLRLPDVQQGATELRERLRQHVHSQLWKFDAAKGAALYGEFLKPFLRRLGTRAEIDFFTTNYDRVVESIWSERHHNDVFGVTTVLRGGFRLVNEYSPSKEWDPASYDEPSATGDCVVRLCKLHGSLNWRLKGSTVVETSADEYSDRESTLIYPLQGVKDCSRQPFATLFERWRRAVSAATDCVAIGASMRDPEVTDPLESTANQSPDFRLWLVDPMARTIRERLREGTQARCIAVVARFGDENLGEQIAAAAFSARRNEVSPLEL